MKLSDRSLLDVGRWRNIRTPQVEETLVERSRLVRTPLGPQLVHERCEEGSLGSALRKGIGLLNMPEAVLQRLEAPT
jgi:hypothetical protein